jgi:cyclophilin family peptidyl-prolyl cis-trans isomerase/HEAT repeat protein
LRALSPLIGLALAAGAWSAAPAQRPANAAARNVALYARLLSMTDNRVYSAAAIDSALSSGWAPLRAATALAIGQLAQRGTPAAATLRRLLGDPDVKVASNAAYALGLLRDSSSIPDLTRALGDRAAVAREAAWALGEIGAPARRAIIDALAKPPTDEARTIQLLLAAAKMRPVPVAELRPYLRMEERASIMWAAAYAIARPHAPAGVRDLIALSTYPTFVAASAAERSSTGSAAARVAIPPLATAEAYVTRTSGRQRARAEIARALGKTAAGDSLADAAIAVLLRLAHDPHPHVRINAVRSLATFGIRGREAVVAATHDLDANTRVAAAQSLGTVLDTAQRIWTGLLAADTSLVYRASLVASAARAGAWMPQVRAWREHPDWHYRAASLAAVAASPDTASVFQFAVSTLGDRDPRIRAAAYGVLAGNDTMPLPANALANIRTGLLDPSPTVRVAVMGALESHARAADVPKVMDAYLKAQSDSVNDARVAAIHYVASAWRRDSVGFTTTLRERLEKIPAPADRTVRVEAAEIPVFKSWGPVPGTSHPLAWYEDIVRTLVIPALAGKMQRATLRTIRGDISLELFGADAPLTVANFLSLARAGYYRNTHFHRVVPNFVIQDGDPEDTGNGGPGYSIRDEFNPRRYDRGMVGMALSGPDTGGSQYFITHSPQPHLDGHYTIFGRVIGGMSVVDAILQYDRITAVRAN